MTTTSIDPREEAWLTALRRRNWIVLGVLTLLSGITTEPDIILGVLGGGIVAALAYQALERSLRQVLTGAKSQGGFHIAFTVRLGLVALAIMALIVLVNVHPVALACGLSIVVINIIGTTMVRTFWRRQ